MYWYSDHYLNSFCWQRYFRVNEERCAIRISYCVLTTDAIFALQSLITQKINNRQLLYCCLIDYKKDSGTINRENLLYKIVKMEITGKVLRIIISLCVHVRAYVKRAGYISEEFSVNTGLLQREVFSQFFSKCLSTTWKTISSIIANP